MTADQPLFPDPREAVPLGCYLDLAIWLLGRNPHVADLANRIPGVVTTGPRGHYLQPDPACTHDSRTGPAERRVGRMGRR
jgi:hypothetical protein